MRCLVLNEFISSISQKRSFPCASLQAVLRKLRLHGTSLLCAKGGVCLVQTEGLLFISLISQKHSFPCLPSPVGEGGPLAVDEVSYRKQPYLVNFSKTLISVRVFASGVTEITPARIEIISLRGSFPDS